MFSRLINKIYPFITLSILEVQNLIHIFSELLNFTIILFQIVIAVLTVYKLYKDLKYHKYKSIEKTQNDVEKKNPIYFYILNFLKSFKK